MLDVKISLGVRPALEWVVPSNNLAYNYHWSLALRGHLPVRRWFHAWTASDVRNAQTGGTGAKWTPDLTSDVSVKSRACGFYATGPRTECSWSGIPYLNSDGFRTVVTNGTSETAKRRTAARDCRKITRRRHGGGDGQHWTVERGGLFAWALVRQSCRFDFVHGVLQFLRHYFLCLWRQQTNT